VAAGVTWRRLSAAAVAAASLHAQCWRQQCWWRCLSVAALCTGGECSGSRCNSMSGAWSYRDRECCTGQRVWILTVHSTRDMLHVLGFVAVLTGLE
jgi:hypothetical protein